MNSKTYFSLFIVSIFLQLLFIAAAVYDITTLTTAPMLLASLMIVGLWIYTIIDAARTKDLNPLWIIALMSASMIAMIIYWYKKYKSSLIVTS
jgi:hypothetical protein